MVAAGCLPELMNIVSWTPPWTDTVLPTTCEHAASACMPCCYALPVPMLPALTPYTGSWLDVHAQASQHCEERNSGSVWREESVGAWLANEGGICMQEHVAFTQCPPSQVALYGIVVSPAACVVTGE